MPFRPLLLSLILLLAAGSARAQDTLENDPGYVDVRTVESWFNAPATVEINVRGALLKMVAAATQESDPELNSLLSKIKAIHVRVFSTADAPLDALNTRATALAERLKEQGWETVVRVREEDENVNIQLKTRDDTIAGLVVLVTTESDSESVFINIVGEIDPEEIGRIGRTFDIDVLKDDTLDTDQQR